MEVGKDKAKTLVRDIYFKEGIKCDNNLLSLYCFTLVDLNCLKKFVATLKALSCDDVLIGKSTQSVINEEQVLDLRKVCTNKGQGDDDNAEQRD